MFNTEQSLLSNFLDKDNTSATENKIVKIFSLFSSRFYGIFLHK